MDDDDDEEDEEEDEDEDEDMVEVRLCHATHRLGAECDA